MKSKIAEAIKLEKSSIAILWTDEKPEQTIQFKEGRWGCVISLMTQAAKGKTAVFDEDTCGCPGGAKGLGFKDYELGEIEHFLSTGEECEREGEFYKKTPEYARQFIASLPDIEVATKYVVFKPLEEVEADEEPKAIVFLVNADQLSGLVTLANFDQPTKDNVTIFFGAGCHSTIIEVLEQAESENPKALIGLTDPSARKYIDSELLSFSLPYQRFLELEAEVENSFLTQGACWPSIKERI
ncbi:DUF169 domain-containing protein [Fuchsiella alkaliacetigena]|uniref:DUF169 domain-containing protein n=1 Tax=Fuchsiella alkaliacetigena TaxID=957042 RepID=UPI00200B5EE6|nr:DUF169 domain-containing protein [Fuchsiella alkaliacetigena]MCK8826024.1 DUF169 domain-containing protein [Fuchsiella alkaliacetigena]